MTFYLEKRGEEAELTRPTFHGIMMPLESSEGTEGTECLNAWLSLNKSRKTAFSSLLPLLFQEPQLSSL